MGIKAMNTYSIVGYNDRGENCTHTTGRTREAAISRFKVKMNDFQHGELIRCYSHKLYVYVRPAHVWEPLPNLLMSP